MEKLMTAEEAAKKYNGDRSTIELVLNSINTCVENASPIATSCFFPASFDSLPEALQKQVEEIITRDPYNYKILYPPNLGFPRISWAHLLTKTNSTQNG